MLDSLSVLGVNSSPFYLIIKYKLYFSNIKFVVVKVPSQDKSCLDHWSGDEYHVSRNHDWIYLENLSKFATKTSISLAAVGSPKAS